MIRRDERHQIVDTTDRVRDPSGRALTSAVRCVADAYGMHWAAALSDLHNANRERHRSPATDGPNRVDGWS
jgi:hypothetical protein